MGCGCKKDQTPSEVWEYLDQSKLSAYDETKPLMGIATFLIPAPDVGILESKVVWVDNISRTEAEKRAANCFAFQWAPKGMPISVNGKATKVDLIDELMLADCTSKKCSPSGCSMGCYCLSTDSSTTNCKKNPIVY